MSALLEREIGQRGAPAYGEDKCKARSISTAAQTTPTNHRP
jgi:hypothetical protein